MQFCFTIVITIWSFLKKKLNEQVKKFRLYPLLRSCLQQNHLCMIEMHQNASELHTDFSTFFRTSNLALHAGDDNQLQHSSTYDCLDCEYVELQLLFNWKTLSQQLLWSRNRSQYLGQVDPNRDSISWFLMPNTTEGY